MMQPRAIQATAAWYIVQCPGGQEARAAVVLRRLGYGETFWPTRKVRLTGVQIKRNAGKQFRVVPWVPGYVFTCTDRLDVFRIHEAKPITLHVLSPGGLPYALTDEDMGKMRDYPERIRAKVEEIAALEAAERAARLPRLGEPAKIVEGPLSGHSGAVVGKRKGEWCVNLGALEAWVRAEWVEREA